LREVFVGNLDLAKRQAEEARSLSDIKYIQGLVAITFGLAGDSAKATQLADDLAQRYPESTRHTISYPADDPSGHRRSWCERWHRT